jgi:hypothetical protein
MAIKFFFVKDTYVSGALPADTKLVNRPRPVIVVAALDPIGQDPAIQTLVQIKPNDAGIYQAADPSASYTKLVALVAAMPSLYAGPYDTEALAEAAKALLVPKSDEELVSGAITLTGLDDDEIVPSATKTWASLALVIPPGSTVTGIEWFAAVTDPDHASSVVITPASGGLTASLAVVGTAVEGDVDVIVNVAMVVNGLAEVIMEACTLTVAAASS